MAQITWVLEAATRTLVASQSEISIRIPTMFSATTKGALS